MTTQYPQSPPILRLHPRRLVVIALVVYTLQGVSASMLGVAWPTMRITFSLPLDAAGILLAASMLGHLISSFNNGRFLAWRGMGAALTIGALVIMAGQFSIATAPTWWLLVTATLLSGWGMGMLNPAINTFIANQQTQRLMHWLHACFGIGATLGPLLMTTLITNGSGWQSGYVLIGILFLVSAVIFWRTRWQWGEPENDRVETETAVSPGQTLRQPIVWLSISVFMLYTGLEVATGQWTYSLFTEARQVSPAAAGLWISGFWGSLTLGRLLLGWLNPRQAKTIVRGSIAIVLLGAGFMWLNAGWLSQAAVMMIGLGLAAIFPVLMTETPRVVGTMHAANAIGFQIGAAGVGASLLPGAAGVLAARWGLEIIAPFLMVTAVALLLLYELIQLRTRR